MSIRRSLGLCMLPVFLFFSGPQPAIGQAPDALSFQGYLTDGAGDPLPGPATITVSLHADGACSSLQWTRTFSGVTLNGGVFDVALTGGTPDLAQVPMNEPRWLKVEAEGQALGCTALASAPYALGLRQVRITPETATDGPNIIGGAYNNFAAEGVVGAVVVGGGDPDDPTCQPNRALASYAAVVGGIGNGAAGFRSFVGGGLCNTVTGDKSAILGGGLNKVEGDEAVVGGGSNNAANGVASVISGGRSNGVYGESASIGGGGGNEVPNDFGTVGGGRRNSVRAVLGTIAGGGANPENATSTGNVVNSIAGSIGGGGGNTVGGVGGTSEDGDYGVIGGGLGNTVYDPFGTVGGGNGNVAGFDGTGEWAATVAGGYQNQALGAYSFIGGGNGNFAAGSATVAGGRSNEASNTFATIAGGEENGAGSYGTVAGGSGNTAFLSHASVGGGSGNYAGDLYSTIGGGADNLISLTFPASGDYGTIGGGRANAILANYGAIGGGGPSNTSDAANTGNRVFSDFGTVGGGAGNHAGDETTPENGRWSVVGGGFENVASGPSAVVAGGNGNRATGEQAAVLGGFENASYGSNSTVAGGQNNIAGRSDIVRLGSTVSGGYLNEASGDYAVVPGGYDNLASAINSFAAGYGAEAVHVGSFVWSDRSNTSEPFVSTGQNQFLIRAAGGVGINTNDPGGPALRVVRDVAGAASWQNHVALIDNSSTDAAADVLSLRVGNASPTTTNAFISFKYNGNNAAGFVRGNGSGGVEYNSSGADYAEYLPRLDPAESLLPGDVVGVFSGRVSKRTEGADQVMVVSTAPIVLGNMPEVEEPEEAGYAKVSFLGQAPVKVRGPVAAGDFLVPSGLEDGTAVAVKPESVRPEQLQLVFATAWESRSAGGTGTVNAAIGINQAAASARVITALQDQVETMKGQLAGMKEHQASMEEQASAMLERLQRLEARTVN